MSSSRPAHTGAKDSEASLGGKERQNQRNSKKRQRGGITQGQGKEKGKKTLLVLSTESGGSGAWGISCNCSPALPISRETEVEHSLDTNRGSSEGDTSPSALPVPNGNSLQDTKHREQDDNTAIRQSQAFNSQLLFLWLLPNHVFDFWCSRLGRRNECYSRWENSWGHYIHEKRNGKQAIPEPEAK